VNREAELDRPSRVACSDLIALISLIIQYFECVCHTIVNNFGTMLGWIFGAVISRPPKNLQTCLVAERSGKLTITRGESNDISIQIALQQLVCLIGASVSQPL
jgi:hypothetical protein